MKRIVIILGILTAILYSISCNKPVNNLPSAKPSQELSMEQIVKTAHWEYDQFLKEGKTKKEAVEAVVKFLKSQKLVKKAKVTAASTIRVIFTNKEEIILMLGRGRL